MHKVYFHVFDGSPDYVHSAAPANPYPSLSPRHALNPALQAAAVLPPRQITRMVDALLQDGRCRQPGLFVEKGVEEEVRGIRGAVDSGVEFPPHCAHSMVEVKNKMERKLFEARTLKLLPPSSADDGRAGFEKML